MFVVERQWGFVADMNYSGSITISDIWLWLKWLYFYPGDLVVLAISYAPKIHAFLEFDTSYYGGWFAGIVSFFAWITVLNIVLEIYLNE